MSLFRGYDVKNYMAQGVRPNNKEKKLFKNELDFERQADELLRFKGIKDVKRELALLKAKSAAYEQLILELFEVAATLQMNMVSAFTAIKQLSIGEKPLLEDAIDLTVDQVLDLFNEYKKLKQS